jgi:hypothetical protein
VIGEIVAMKTMATANVEEVENCILSLIFVLQGLNLDELNSLSKMVNGFCIYVCGVKGRNVHLRFESVLGLKPSRKHLLQNTSTICHTQIRSRQIPP